LCQWATKSTQLICGTPSDYVTISGAGLAGANQDYKNNGPTQWIGVTDPTFLIEFVGGQWVLSSIDDGNQYYSSTLEFPCAWHLYAGGTGPAPTGLYDQSLPPSNLTLPVITGTAQVGQTLSGSNGTWTNSPTGYSYHWYANGVAIGGATANTFLLTAAQVGTVITFQVTAHNAEGASSPAVSTATSAVIDTPPAGVTNLAAIYKANSATEIDLTWTDNATNETEYRIYRSTDGGAYGLIDTIAANSTSYNDTTVTASHVYTYKVAPANSGGETLSGPVTPTVASFLCTTTGAGQVLTIAALTVSSAMTVDWGDTQTDSYTGAGARTHTYASAGTYTVKFLQPLLVTAFTISDNKVTLNSSTITPIKNVTSFQANGLKAGTFNSADVSAWRPTTFYLYSMPAGYAGTFNSTDVSAWRPTNFQLSSMPAGYAGTFNSADVSAWRPTNFNLNSMPASYSGTFNSADVSAWRPTNFNLYSMPTGYAGTFNSTDVSAWRPIYFYLYSMPAGYAGTFNSTDVSAWRPTNLYLYSMPTGYAGTFNSVDVSAWRPTNFYLYSMPTATFGITITAGGFSGWIGATTVDLSADALSQASVDQILADLYTAFATRTASGGTITLNGTGNAAPSGIYQAHCPPTSGLEDKYELLNDSCGINPTKKWSTANTN
jgi:hypothetical protein